MLYGCVATMTQELQLKLLLDKAKQTCPEDTQLFASGQHLNFGMVSFHDTFA